MSNTKYEPVGNNIIIRKLKDEYQGGLQKADSAFTEEKAIGEIVAFAREFSKYEIYGGEVVVGTKIIYRELNGDTIPNEEDLLIIEHRDILAVVRE